MLIVLLHGPPGELILIGLAVVAAIALLGAFIATKLYASSGAQRTLAALAAGTVAGFALTYGFFALSMTSLSPIFSSMSAGPLLTTIAIIALGGGFAVAASILRFGK
jgi:hypothetical protein